MLFNYRYFFFLFNRSDRFICKDFLTKFYEYMYGMKAYRWNAYRHTLALMHLYQTVDVGVYYSAVAHFRNKLTRLEQFKKAS